ncbi:MAG TPA: hypothetical protein VF794_18955 [Archangium sp.]|jgi:hypothetical protein|uniref:hypothetical protein n=1 Tax=Archangium sp. TaxID=1872627 RepID=UPI002ED8FCA0
MIGASLLLVSVLQQAPRAYVDPSYAPPAEEGIHFHAALELSAQGLSSGTGANGVDGFVVAFPRLGVKGGDEFEFELGAPLRLRMFDQEPLQLEQDYGRLRRQDWDERSDYAQILRELRIGRDDSHYQLRAGNFSVYSLGAGWLVNRYHNRLSPDYHPAGANFTAYLGPTRVELFASDVLAARLFAGEVRLDLGRVLSEQEKAFDRYLLSLDVAHDFGTSAGGTAPPLSAASVGLQVGAVKNEKFQLWVQAAAGARADTLVESVPDYGAAFGLVMASRPKETVEFSGRLEARRQGGGFRFGLFGAGYELARFSGVGLRELPLAEEPLPTTFSGYGQFALSVSPGAPEDLELTASASGEYFVTTGRVDADAVLQANLPGGKTSMDLRVILTDITGRPRYSVGAEVRHRFLPALYGIAMGGTEHFPQAEGRLRHGFTAGLGVGVDFKR